MDDMLRYSCELFAAVVLSSVAKATLVSMDPSPALGLTGVHSFGAAKDLPGETRNRVLDVLARTCQAKAGVECWMP